MGKKTFYKGDNCKTVKTGRMSLKTSNANIYTKACMYSKDF